MKAKELFLAADIGNSRVSIGVFAADWVVFFGGLPSDPGATGAVWADRIRSLLLEAGMSGAFSGAGVCSVVPALTPPLIQAIREVVGVTPLEVSVNLSSGVRVALDRPEELGADRLANAAAVRAQWPDRPALVVDIGTAATFDCVSREGVFLGGAIAPGPAIGAEALRRGTARLPLVEPGLPPDVIGRNTADAMRSGLFLGCAAMIEGMTARIKERLGENTVVIGTGGWVTVLAPAVRCFDVVDPHLTVKGVRILWQKNGALPASPFSPLGRR